MAKVKMFERNTENKKSDLKIEINNKQLLSRKRTKSYSHLLK